MLNYFFIIHFWNTSTDLGNVGDVRFKRQIWIQIHSKIPDHSNRLNHYSSNELWFHRAWLETAWRSYRDLPRWVQSSLDLGAVDSKPSDFSARQRNSKISKLTFQPALSQHVHRFEDRRHIHVNPNHVFQQFWTNPQYIEQENQRSKDRFLWNAIEDFPGLGIFSIVVDELTPI